MFSYQLYKVLHLSALFLLFTSLGGHAALAMRGGDLDKKVRRLFIISHGIAMVLVLVGGMGLMARIGIMGAWPGWIFGKLAIWLALGGVIALFKRKPAQAPLFFWLVIVLGVTAASLVIYRGPAPGDSAGVTGHTTSSVPTQK